MPLGCTDSQLAGLRDWASRRTIDEIHYGIEGYLGRYPSLCPESDELGSYEQYARGYSIENQPAPQPQIVYYRGFKILIQPDGDAEITIEGRKVVSGGLEYAKEYIDDYLGYTEGTPKQLPPAASCEDRGDCPSPPTTGSGACPRGDSIPLSAADVDFWGNYDCPDGYYADIIAPANLLAFTPAYGACICNTAPNQEEIRRRGREAYEKQTGESLTGSLSSIIKLLPQLLIVMVIVSIIGAFKR